MGTGPIFSRADLTTSLNKFIGNIEAFWFKYAPAIGYWILLIIAAIVTFGQI